MLNPCRFTLDNGQPCGNHARRSSHFCRHHSHQALQRRGPTTRPATLDTPEQRAQRALAWRSLHKWLPTADQDELDTTISNLLHALGERQISHRSAGRLFEAVEDRRRVLLAESVGRQILESAEAIQAGFIRRTGASSEDLANDTLALRSLLQKEANL